MDIDIRQGSETAINKGFVVLKTEKLSAAIHLLTGHLSRHEPIREGLRRASLAIMEAVTTSSSDAEVESMLGLLYVAKHSGIISPANSAVLEYEYESLSKLIVSTKIDVDIPAEISGKISKGQLKKSAVMPSPLGLPATTTKKLSVNTDGLSRRELILNIIVGRESYSLGEVAGRVSGVSEKTIQRDLLALVESGVLRKSGERRWSRYSRT